MKKCLIYQCMLGLLVFALSTSVYAGGVDNKHNYSAEYIRTLNRNAATDSADAVAYNPAGIARFEDGFYTSLSIHGTLKTYTNTIPNTVPYGESGDFETDIPSFVPGLFAAYKKDQWALFGGFYIAAGGGSVEYETGNWTTRQIAMSYLSGANSQLALASLPALYDTISAEKLEADSFYKTFALGGAYEINELISIALGLRYISAIKEATGSMSIAASSGLVSEMKAELDYEQEASGLGAVLGVNLSPVKALNIAFRYEMETALDFENDVKKDDIGVLPTLGIVDGTENSRNLPALFGFGVSYQFTPAFRGEANLTYYLQDSADWDGAEDNFDNGYDLGLMGEYRFNPQWMVSAGFLLTNAGAEPDYMLLEAPELDANSIGGGVVFSPNQAWDLNFGFGKVFYKDEDRSDGVGLDKDIYFLAFGLQYKYR